MGAPRLAPGAPPSRKMLSTQARGDQRKYVLELAERLSAAHAAVEEFRGRHPSLDPSELHVAREAAYGAATGGLNFAIEELQTARLVTEATTVFPRPVKVGPQGGFAMPLQDAPQSSLIPDGSKPVPFAPEGRLRRDPEAEARLPRITRELPPEGAPAQGSDVCACHDPPIPLAEHFEHGPVKAVPDDEPRLVRALDMDGSVQFADAMDRVHTVKVGADGRVGVTVRGKTYQAREALAAAGLRPLKEGGKVVGWGGRIGPEGLNVLGAALDDSLQAAFGDDAILGAPTSQQLARIEELAGLLGEPVPSFDTHEKAEDYIGRAVHRLNDRGKLKGDARGFDA